jgi:hypothetical protein
MENLWGTTGCILQLQEQICVQYRCVVLFIDDMSVPVILVGSESSDQDRLIDGGRDGELGRYNLGLILDGLHSSGIRHKQPTV